jgi:pimeloyl-ACP methyl ester carboxylesterase
VRHLRGPRASRARAKTAGGPTLTARHTALGTVLTTSRGFTVYAFEADKGTRSACFGACAAAWPPVTTTSAPRGQAAGRPSENDVIAGSTMSTVRVRHRRWPHSPRIADWREVRGERFAELRSITPPTLVVNGSKDVMIPTINSYWLSQHIPSAQLIIYPDVGHGSLFQYPELFLAQATIPPETAARKEPG